MASSIPLSVTTPAALSNAGITSKVTSAASTTTASATATDKGTLASNFTAFLQLLTTQLRNQNPLDPLDTNQFTQQLVQFAQVEQQLKSNEQLSTLVTLEQSVQSTQALAFVGKTVAVDGTTSRLRSGQAFWSVNVPRQAAVTVNIQNSAGVTVYSGSYTMPAGTQTFMWDGRGSNGQQFPDGDYTIQAVGKDANGQPVGVATQVEGMVESVDLTKSPPLLSIAGRDYTIDKIKRVVTPSI